jgi:hypothetical protein
MGNLLRIEVYLAHGSRGWEIHGTRSRRVFFLHHNMRTSVHACNMEEQWEIKLILFLRGPLLPEMVEFAHDPVTS